MRFEEIVNAHYKNLNANDQYILRIVSADRKACVKLSINELAQRCNVSRTTILRFTQKLGFEGYSAFKAFLAFEGSEGAVAAVQEQDLVECLYDDMAALKQQVSREKLWPVCALLHRARRVFVYGTGATQKEIAKELQRIFMSLRKYLHIVDGEAELQSLLDDLQAEDVVLLISYSGANSFLKEIVQSLAIRAVPYISLTQCSENFLAQHARCALYVPITPVRIPTGPMGIYNSTVLFFIVADILMRRYVEYIGQQESSQQKDGENV